jgi:spore coat polysaccharide biosynthesis protein SpsF
MKIGFLITARLKSSRLKFKLLKDLNGSTVIDRVIERAKKVNNCEYIILCTSEINQDLPLVHSALNNDIYYFNGDAEDVLDRLLKAAEFFGLDHIICMTADNPLFSIKYSNKISLALKKDPGIDYIYTSSLPIGLNPYAISVRALKTICLIKEEVDTEIWGPLINRPEVFKVEELPVSEIDLMQIERVTLDEQKDYDFLCEVFKNFPKNYLIQEQDLKKLLSSKPELSQINSSVLQRVLDEITLNRIDSFFKNNLKMILEIKDEVYKNI